MSELSHSGSIGFPDYSTEDPIVDYVTAIGRVMGLGIHSLVFSHTVIHQLVLYNSLLTALDISSPSGHASLSHFSLLDLTKLSLGQLIVQKTTELKPATSVKAEILSYFSRAAFQSALHYSIDRIANRMMVLRFATALPDAEYSVPDTFERSKSVTDHFWGFLSYFSSRVVYDATVGFVKGFAGWVSRTYFDNFDFSVANTVPKMSKEWTEAQKLKVQEPVEARDGSTSFPNVNKVLVFPPLVAIDDSQSIRKMAVRAGIDLVAGLLGTVLSHPLRCNSWVKMHRTTMGSPPLSLRGVIRSYPSACVLSCLRSASSAMWEVKTWLPGILEHAVEVLDREYQQ